MENNTKYGLERKFMNNDYVSAMSTTPDYLKSLLSKTDKDLLGYIVKLHAILTNETLDLNNFKDVVEAIENLKKTSDHDYLKSLVRPEFARGSKIPTNIPVPSSSFQLKQSFSIKTNSLGNACIILNPYYLSSGSGNSTVFVNTDETLDGASTNNNFVAIDVGQEIPAVYNQYRLVSGSVVARYIGRLDIAQGLIGGAILFDQSIIPTPIGDPNPNIAKYGEFNLSQDAYYWSENFTLEGMRELYFPLDTTYEQYQTLNTSKNGFGQVIYVLGGPPSQTIFKVDLYFNMECLPDVSFLNYIPTSVNYSSTAGKDQAIKKVQARPVMSENANSQTTMKEQGGGGNIFSNLMDTVGTILPAAMKLVSLI